jgi:hypothetical protein
MTTTVDEFRERVIADFWSECNADKVFEDTGAGRKQMTDEARFEAVMAAVHAARQERGLPKVAFGIAEAAGFCAALDAAIKFHVDTDPSNMDINSLLWRRQVLLDKKFAGTIALKEQMDLEEVRQSLDKIDDERYPIPGTSQFLNRNVRDFDHSQPQPCQEVMQHSDPHSRQHNAPAPAVSSAEVDPSVMVTHSYSATEIIEAMAQALCCGDKACQEGHSGCFVVEADKAEARAAYLIALELSREATERQIAAAAQELYGRETVTKEWARRMVAAVTDARIAEVEEMP